MSRLVVLGGNSGIGAAVAAHGRSMGVHTETFKDRDPDVRSHQKLAGLLRSYRPTHLVYSVGVNALEWSAYLSREDFFHLMEVNVWGFLDTVKILQAIGDPVSVVAVTSDAAWRPMRTSAAYCASKAALEMAVKVTSRELAPLGWRINAVAPGKVADTPMTEYVDRRVMEVRGWDKEKADAYEAASSPIGRALEAYEVAEVICDVVFSEVKGFTGAVVPVNGGR
jgi:NAD(P)-dependent dehydrogenase (short-subunit alcohol dehydrogenase family)